MVRTKVSDALIVNQMQRLIEGRENAADDEDGMALLFGKLGGNEEEENKQGKVLLRNLYGLIENRIVESKYFYIEGHVPDMQSFHTQIECFIIKKIKDCTFLLEKVDKVEDKAK